MITHISRSQEVQAVQFLYNPENINKLQELVGKEFELEENNCPLILRCKDRSLYIEEFQWLVKYNEGSLVKFSNEAFRATFKPTQNKT